MKLAGHITIHKQYVDTPEFMELILDDHNVISDGLAYGLTNLFTADAGSNLVDYQFKYFQLGGQTYVNYIPDFGESKSFYSLASALTTSQYGTSSYQQPITLNQVINSNGNFVAGNPNYITSANAFIQLDPQFVSINLDRGFSTRILIDEDLANGISISEIGLFLANPTGNPQADEPMLAAYRQLSTAINKTSDFRLIIDWSISVIDLAGNSNDYLITLPDSDLASGSTIYARYRVSFLSGIDTYNMPGTGNEIPDRFDILIPKNYYTSGNPLIVAIHGLGQTPLQFSNVQSTTSDTNASYPYGTSSFVDDACANGYYVILPLGPYVTGKAYSVNGQTFANYPQAGAIRYNWTSKPILDHLKKIVKYVIDRYPIDQERIYLHGFSAGGGCAGLLAGNCTDLNSSSWVPAAVSFHSGAINSKKIWWAYQDSSYGASAGYWNTPENIGTGLRDSGKIMIFWAAGQGIVSNMPDVSQMNASNSLINPGPGWSSLSSLSPNATPLNYWEGCTVDYNLYTSSVFSPSTCILYNLTQTPLRLHYHSDDSQGGFIYEPNNILSGVLTSLSSIFNSQNQIIVSSNYIGENHAVSTINNLDVLNFFNGKTRQKPLQASTVVTRSGNYWYFEVPTTAAYTAGAETEAWITSGLAMFVWKIDNNSNSLWISGTKHINDDNTSSLMFNSDLTEFSVDATHPLNVYNVSGMPNFPNQGAFPAIRRIKIKNYGGTDYDIKYYPQITSESFGPEYTLNRNNLNWNATGIGTVAVRDNGHLQIRRFGYYKITPI
jgi:hypothetical protein